MPRFVHILIALIIAAPAAAQVPSPEELAAQIDANLQEQSSYLALLSDPDPRRSREAMRVFLASGEPELARMALDFGLTSNNPVLQRMALEGFFDSAPALQITLDGSTLENTKNFNSDLTQLGGSLDGEQKGYLNLKLGAWDEEQSCWLWSHDKSCAVRLTDAASAIYFRGYWYPMELEDGVLSGVSSMYYTKEPVPFSIPVVP